MSRSLVNGSLFLLLLLDKIRLGASMEHLPPDSRGRIETNVAGADFFDNVLSSSLAGLAPGTRVMDMDSGIGLQSLRTAAKGFEVTAYEPQSSGFSEMLNHRDIIKACWHGVLPDATERDTYLSSETMPPEDERAEFAFAINALEHVRDIESFIATTIGSLIPKELLSRKGQDGLNDLILFNFDHSHK